MIYCTLDLICPLNLKDRLCCIYCSKKNDCPESCKRRNKSCDIDIDGDKLYSKSTGETVCQDITTMTDMQAKNLLEG